MEVKLSFPLLGSSMQMMNKIAQEFLPLWSPGVDIDLFTALVNLQSRNSISTIHVMQRNY